MLGGDMAECVVLTGHDHGGVQHTGALPVLVETWIWEGSNGLMPKLGTYRALAATLPSPPGAKQGVRSRGRAGETAGSSTKKAARVTLITMPESGACCGMKEESGVLSHRTVPCKC